MLYTWKQPNIVNQQYFKKENVLYLSCGIF